jgi:hypothetical protein
MPKNSFLDNARGLAGTASKTIGTIGNTVNTLRTEGFGAALRSINLLPGGETGLNSQQTSATFSAPAKDWRLKLSLPSNPVYLTTNIVRPLVITDGLVFPYTPQVQISHTANYDSMQPIHNNYTFLSYQNSSVGDITITAPFYCEDATEAAYWVAATHFLRSVTKMQFGEDVTAGAPPPVLKLNGYGDHIFNNVPVVVKNFSVSLPNDVDYISTGLSYQTEQERMLAEQEAEFEDEPTAQAPEGVAWAPVKSSLQITVAPLYSRQQVRNFSLDKFVKGDYLLGDTSDPNNKTGFI